MNAEQESADEPEPRACRRCGAPLPPQKAGRPRQWCSQRCRQSAYEERHGLESWKDKQPKVNDLSEVVEVMQARPVDLTHVSGTRTITSPTTLEEPVWGPFARTSAARIVTPTSTVRRWQV